MRVICWNVKGRETAVSLLVEHLRLDRYQADAAFVLEPPGSLSTVNVVDNPVRPHRRLIINGIRFSHGGVGNERETVAFIWNKNNVTIAPPPNDSNNVSRAACAAIRMPVGLTITDNASGNGYFIVVWHAPTNGGDISRGVTAFFGNVAGPVDVLMGDFNTERETGFDTMVLESPARAPTSLNSSSALVNAYDKVLVRPGLHGAAGVAAGRYFGDAYTVPARFFDTYSDHLPVYVDLP